MANIDKSLLQNLRADLDAAFSAIAEKHGVKLSLGSFSFSSDLASVKLTVAAISGDGTATSKESVDLKRYCRSLDLEDRLSQVFEINGEKFVLEGYRPRASARPFTIKRVSDGKKFISSIKAVYSALGMEVPFHLRPYA